MGKIRNLDQLLYALKHGYKIKEGAEKTAAFSHAVLETKKAEQHFCISIAGRIIEINSQYKEVYDLCVEYMSDVDPEMMISITDDDIAYEKHNDADNEITYKDSYLETLAVYRKICTAMLTYDTFLMHGAVIATGQSAYMFTAKSGTGKTTHIKKWLENLDNAFVVNGDKPLIRITEKEIIACGTPWCGKEQLGRNCMIPLRAIVFMERGESNEMTEISYSEAFPCLLQQTYQPNNIEMMKKTLKLLSQMKDKVYFYKFTFDNMQDDAFDISYGTLTRGQS